MYTNTYIYTSIFYLADVVGAWVRLRWQRLRRRGDPRRDEVDPEKRPGTLLVLSHALDGGHVEGHQPAEDWQQHRLLLGLTRVMKISG